MVPRPDEAGREREEEQEDEPTGQETLAPVEVPEPMHGVEAYEAGLGADRPGARPRRVAPR